MTLDIDTLHRKLRTRDSDQQRADMLAAQLSREEARILDGWIASERAKSEHVEQNGECAVCGDLDANYGVDYYWHPASAVAFLPQVTTDASGTRTIWSCPECGSYMIEAMPNDDPDPGSLASACRDCGFAGADALFGAVITQ